MESRDNDYEGDRVPNGSSIDDSSARLMICNASENKSDLTKIVIESE